MAKLTKAEAAWVAELQEVLDRCPSKRLGFFTIGDSTVSIYDNKKDDKITEHQDRKGSDFCTAVRAYDAALGEIKFPFNVHSTSG